MKYINNKLTLAIFISCLSLISCERYDAEEVSLTATVSSNIVNVGDTVDFTIFHNNTARNLVIFTGDAGHQYSLSGDFKLIGLTDQQIADSIYREPNPIIRRFSLNFSGQTSIPDVVEHPNMELVDDALNPGNKVLKVQLFPNDWGKVLKVYPRVGVGNENQDFTINLRFDSNDIYKKVGDTWVTGSTKANFRVVTEVIGKTTDGVVSWTFNQSNPNGLWYANVITPNVAYFNHTINLTKWIANWEKANSLKLETIECITMKFIGDNNAAYQGNIYITSMTLGIDGYYAFDTGVCLPITDGSGQNKFSYTYSQPGEYNVTIIGSNNSSKNYENDGYQSGRNTISGEEYKYNNEYVTIPIQVVEQ